MKRERERWMAQEQQTASEAKTWPNSERRDENETKEREGGRK